MENYLKLIENTAKRKWNGPALRDRGGVSYTYAEMCDRIGLLHSLFRAASLRKGDKIAVCGKNSSNWAISFIAANAYGCVAVPLLSDFHPEGISQLTAHSESRLLFVDEDIWKKVSVCGGARTMAVVSLQDFSFLECSDAAFGKNAAVEEQKYRARYPQGIVPEDVAYPGQEDLDELAIINYTSGTTSAPKGVMLKNRTLSSNINFIIDNIKGEDNDRVLSMLPMAHMYGMAVEFLFPVCAGYELNFLGKAPTPRILLDALADVRPFLIVTVPLVMEKIFYSSVFPVIKKPAMKALLAVPGVSSLIYGKIRAKLMTTFGGRVQRIIMGGAPLNESVEAVMKKVGLPYCVGYGMTECAPLICYEDFSRFVPRSCGKAVDRMEVRIDSPDPQHTVGEIQTRGENVMSGYFRNQEATDAAFTADGWLKTGDMGIMDKDGNVFIKGRCKNMILSANGQNIYPEEIEDKLNSHVFVTESVVVDRNGKIVALVYPDSDAVSKAHEGKEPAQAVDAAMAQLLAEVNPMLPAYSRISKVEVMATEFEKTPKKSIKRFMYS